MRLNQELVLSIVMEEMDGPLVRGVNDCCVSTGRVFGRLHGVDPIDGIHYRTTKEAMRIVKDGGGAKMLAETLMSNAGLVECTQQPGAIGRVTSPVSEMELALAICVDGDTWATKAQDGVMFLSEAEQCWGPSWA